MVPSLSAQNLQCIKIGKDFMFSHGYIKNDFDVDAVGGAGIPGAGGDGSAQGRVAAQKLEQAACGRRARGGRHAARVVAQIPGVAEILGSFRTREQQKRVRLNTGAKRLPTTSGARLIRREGYSE